MAVYSDYAKDRIGWFFGLTGSQLGTLALTSLPVFWAINAQQWPLVGTLALVWALLAVLVVVPVRGRSATGWLLATGKYAVGTLSGWTRFRSHAAAGRAVEIHEGRIVRRRRQQIPDAHGGIRKSGNVFHVGQEPRRARRAAGSPRP